MQAPKNIKDSVNLLDDLLADDITKINDIIQNESASDISELIPQITKYITQSGGKRLRPKMALLCCKMLNAPPTQGLYIGAALELLHTATLLHDDVIDESAKRRGEDTANFIWGNKPSILVGDFLFTQAFNIMLKSQSLKALEEISIAAKKIAEAEVWQLELLGDPSLNKANYLKLIQEKTASLFSAAFSATATANNASYEITEALREYGNTLGICFQIYDDMLDYFGDPNSTGKKIGGDFREKKITAPIIFIYELLTKEEQNKFKEIFDISHPSSNNDLEYIIGCCHKYNAHSLVDDFCNTIIENAINKLKQLSLLHMDLAEDLLCTLTLRKA